MSIYYSDDTYFERMCCHETLVKNDDDFVFRSQSLLNSYHQLCRRLSAASLRKQPNRPGIWPHGICTYVDKTSVVSEYYNPPYYRLAANVLTYNIDKGTLYKTKTVHYSYDTSTGAISSGGGAPLYDRPNSNIAANQRPVEVAKVIWEAAYNMPWRW